MKKYLLLCVLAGFYNSPAYALTDRVDAISVKALSVSGQTLNSTYTYRLASSTGDYTYLKRNVSLSMTGNPLKWVKNNALTLAVTGAVVAAGYAIDELTNQVMTVQGTEPDPAYNVNTHWRSQQFCLGGYMGGKTIEDAAARAEAYGSSTYLVRQGTNGANFILKYTSNNNTVAGCNQYLIQFSGAGNTLSYFWGTYDGIGVDVLNPNNFEVEVLPAPLPDADVWDIVSQVMQANPELMTEVLQDTAGNPYIWPEVATEQASIVDTQVQTAPYYQPSQIADIDDLQAPDVVYTEVPATATDLEIPTDYAREETTQGVLAGIQDLVTFFDSSAVVDEVVDPDVDYLDSIFNPVETDLNSVGDPTGDPTSFMPSLPSYSATCSTLSYPIMGSTFTFPSASQCDKLNVAKGITAWMLYLLTAYMIINLFLSRTGRAVR